MPMAETVHDKSLGQGIVCDASGCIGKLADGAPVSYVLTPEAFEEDCARAALVVASRGEPPADCRATVIGRALWRHCGALTLRAQWLWPWRRFRHRLSAIEEFRSAVVAGSRATRSVCRDFRRIRPGRDWHSRA
jgi:hypothetical protein